MNKSISKFQSAYINIFIHEWAHLARRKGSINLKSPLLEQLANMYTYHPITEPLNEEANIEKLIEEMNLEEPIE